MPRTPSFSYKSTKAGWEVPIPASLSDNGKFRRVYHRTKAEAQAHVRRLKETYTGQRDKAANIPAALAEDAAAASGLLADFGITLKQAAAYYVEQHDRRAKAPTLRKAFATAIKRRRNKRPKTLRDYRLWERKLPTDFLDMNICDIEGRHIAAALDKATGTPIQWKKGQRYVSAVLGDCVKSGFLSDNPAGQMHAPEAATKDDDVSLYTPSELKKLLGACKDYSTGHNRKCADCLAAFATMAFAGIRPDEITRLTWSKVLLDDADAVIRVDRSVAKKSRRRNVRIQSTLRAWLEAVPMEERRGRVAPANWENKARRVKKEAGIDGREKQDALRHSFGTYLLAFENDEGAIRNDMGHTHMKVFYDHYFKAVTKKEAIAYWAILPEGAKLDTIKAA